MTRRASAILFGIAAFAVVAAVGLGVLHATHHLGFGPSGDCTASVNGHTVDIDGEQAENATLIASIAVERGMPARAASIALAVAMQESKLRNITYGDRDSVGLFQQRHSQGWGTRQQLLDPIYATNAFYDALEKVDGYEHMEITAAAQEVQRSAYPTAYAGHEADARALASALTGYSPAAFSCDLAGGAPDHSTKPGPDGLTPRGHAVREDLLQRFGGLRISNADGLGGRGVDVRPDSTEHGWAMAQYAVGNADRLDIRTVTYDGRTWRAGQDGWQSADGPAGTLEVEVFG